MDLELIPSLKPAYEKLKRAVWGGTVHLMGPPSSGKTTLVKKLFEERRKDYLHAYIDCFSVRNQAQLLSKICQAFHSIMNVRRSRAGKSTQRLPEPGAPVSMNDFYEALLEYKNIALDKGYKRIFIVLDQVEVFERTPLMDAFVALCRYNMVNVGLITISCEHPVDLVHYVAVKSPSIAMSLQDRLQVVVCKNWTEEDMVDWILQTPPKEREDLYEKFVKNVVALVSTSEGKDPMMIRMYCQEHFEDFIVYYKQRRKEQVLKQLELEPNSSEITDKELDEYEQAGGFNNNLLVANFLKTFKVMVQKNRDNSKWTSSDKETHLTKNSGVLVVAAYIAAYTKVADDKWNFIRHHRKKRNSRRKVVSQNEPHNTVFPLERLVQIYLELKKKSYGEQILNYIDNNDGVLADIERLENLGILHRQSGFQFCSDARYKLSNDIKKDYVARIGENNQLNLDQFEGLPESFSIDK